MTQPVLSILTICFENPTELNNTLESVYRKYISNEIEQIVIDGSRDSSCQDVLTLHPWVDISVHENDDGIYDAMNKGITNASGRYLLFLNSGDYLSPECDISHVLNRLSTANENQLFYGDSKKRVGNYDFHHQAPAKVEQCHFRKGLAPSHQAIFFPSFFCAKNFYDRSLTVSADTKLIITAFNELKPEHLGEEIAIFSVGGISNTWHSLFDVVSHWQQRRKAREVSILNYAPNLLKNLLKYLLIRAIGMETYYSASLTVRSFIKTNRKHIQH